MAPIKATEDLEDVAGRAEPQMSSSSDWQPGHIVIIVLATLMAAVTIVWLLSEAHRKWRDRSETEYVILGSEVSIEIGDEGLEFEYETEDIHGNVHVDLIPRPAVPHCLAFDIQKLPTLQYHRRDSSLLHRRGQKTLVLQPAEGMDYDMAMFDIQNGRLTVSPFSSRKEGRFVNHIQGRARTPLVTDETREILYGLATAPIESSWRSMNEPFHDLRQ